MNDFTNSSENEDSLDIASREWNRIRNAAKKTGYREGVENGSNDVFQQGFDKGYEEGFKTAFILGKFKSLLKAMPQNAKHPQDVNRILDKTRRGECHICMTASQHMDEDAQKPLSQIINEQRAHSTKCIQTLYQYFQSDVEKLNIDESNLLDIQHSIKESFENN
ncbi:uncharacterized protein LOC143179733 [Calliopsis andreniformis]|uniref:uncharacterized protein LOC143179733 n=1 Tax=Calliopsis andreniformis TaxID=337506 RepID=UPI003FCC5BB0